MGWLFFGLGVLGLLHVANARRPSRNPALLASSFFMSWLTIELAWHHLVVGLVLLLLAPVVGALDSAVGVVGVVLIALSEVLLLAIALETRRTSVTVRGALEDLEVDDAAPRFPRHLVVLPFLLGRRAGVTRVRNLPFAKVAGKTLRLDVTVPSAPVPGGGDRRPALLQVHGGAWVIGDKREQGLPLLGHMAAQGWVGFNANYRLSPAATFPDHLVDVKRAIAWIREHADEWGVDPDFICITGGSAGGHLTALAALTAGEARFQPGFEDADTSLAAAVPFYGVYDFTPDGTFGADPRVFHRFLEPYVIKAFVADEPERFADASPVRHVHADAPPFFVIHGDLDTLAPVEDARRFVEELRAVSREPVVYAEMHGAQHAFEIFPSPRAARVIEGVERFLTTLWTRRHGAGASAARVEQELEGSLTE